MPDEQMTDEPHVVSELSRELSIFHLTMMGLGMMIGAGVFLGLGNAIHRAGPGGAILTFALNGVIAVFTAMSYAELSSAVPRAGGAYNFARIGFGRGTSFLAGWMEWFASSVAGSMYAVTFAIYTLRYLEALGPAGWLPVPTWIAQKLVAAAAACFFVYINYRGASATGRTGALFTLGQTAFLAVVGALGVVVAVREPGRLANFQPFLPHGWRVLLVTMGFTYVAFEGFEVIAQAGDEALEPRRNLPKAMLYSVLIVTVTYVAVAFATVVAVRPTSPELGGSAPWEWIGSFRETGFGEAVSRLMPAADLLLTLAVIFASTSALNATIYSATRTSYALGRDRMLPAFFARISRKRRTPWAALTVTGVIVVVVAALLPTMDVASSASIMFLFLFFLVNVCVIKIRRNLADELTYGYVMPLFPLFPLLAIAAQAALAAWLVHMSWIAWIVAPAWIAAGLGTYLLYSRSHTLATEEEIVELEEVKARRGDEYRIMVTVANPKNALELVRNTYKLCAAKRGRAELLHLVTVPDQIALADGGLHMLEGKEAIVETMMYLSHSFPVGTAVRYCRNVARGIVSAVREKRIDMLVMGWHGRAAAKTGARGLFNLGSTVDPVIERAPCNVVVFKSCGDREFERILVPLAGGPNGAFALEVASILAKKDVGEVTVFTASAARPPATNSPKSGRPPPLKLRRTRPDEALAKAGRRPFDVDQFVEKHRDRLYLPPERVHTKTAEATDVTEAILGESEGHDLIVLGCTREPLIGRIAGSPVPEAVAQRAEKPVAMVKASGGIRSWLRRWI